jgi:hypothetical protein
VTYFRRFRSGMTGASMRHMLATPRRILADQLVLSAQGGRGGVPSFARDVTITLEMVSSSVYLGR